MTNIKVRSMSDLDIMFTEAVEAWENHSNRQLLNDLEFSFPTLITCDSYDEKFDELKELGLI
jgi:hypothetical protein